MIRFYNHKYYFIFLLGLCSLKPFGASAQQEKDFSLYLNSFVAIPLAYDDHIFSSSIPVFLTGEAVYKNFSINVGIGLEFAKSSFSNETEEFTYNRCPPLLVSDSGENLIRCVHSFTRDNTNLRFPIYLNYYFLNRKKFHLFASAGVILDYLFQDRGSYSYFVYDRQQMEIISNQLESSNFRNRYFSYANFDAITQLGMKYNLANRWQLAAGIQYSTTFDKFNLQYATGEHKIFLFSGATFLLYEK